MALFSECMPQCCRKELDTADNTLGFARRQFNAATQLYNEALDQFPTWLIAGLFGFRGAGTL